MTKSEKTCFVIMGFGKKTDYGKKARTLDLDATYRAIIKPAVTACGLRCIRADEVTHSGIIDKPMYQMLLGADLVIADISTANANAIYELGVRHALRPHTTIVIKEQDGAFHFDLNHLATLQYKHLGEDIGSAEAERKRDALANLIRGVLEKDEPETDSPVFTFLTELKGRSLTQTELKQQVDAIEDYGDTLGKFLDAGRKAAGDSRHGEAKLFFQQALDLTTQQKGEASAPDAFIVQQLALATYKEKTNSPMQALTEAWKVISLLSPATSTDPETLGIAGAIQKRLWQQRQDIQCLNDSIDLYGRGFDVKRDYYNGENYALCLDLRAQRQADAAEANYDRITAKKVRHRVIDILTTAFAEASTRERPDYKWMLATMANTSFALGNAKEAAAHEALFRQQQPAGWELETFEEGKKYAQELANAKPAG
ncbi:MAG TPA: tetratricopeptide repeat-containing protein [Polyangiaceae bacterium]|nr:tetratricopeptide repeat-containing protein [Polyangiaceae bacterium]